MLLRSAASHAAASNANNRRALSTTNPYRRQLLPSKESSGYVEKTVAIPPTSHVKPMSPANQRPAGARSSARRLDKFAAGYNKLSDNPNRSTAIFGVISK
jgi:hypothetical protein